MKLEVPENPTIGIDLGTTYCCCAIQIGSTSTIIKNKLGKPTTPSFISFTKKEWIIGEQAK